MKKAILLTVGLFLVIAMPLRAEWTAEDYKAYDAAKKAADTLTAEGKLTEAGEEYKKAVALAEKCEVTKSVVWQLNNAAYMYIKAFMTAVDYQPKIDKMSAMKPSSEKMAFQKETAQLFDANKNLLEEAETLLKKAQGLGPDERQTVKIGSNVAYIDWVLDFTKNNLPEAEAAPAPEAQQPAQQ